MSKTARPISTRSSASIVSASTRPAEAIGLVKELGRVKFDESVEVHVRTGPERRATPTSSCAARIALPHGLGKNVKVPCFAQGDKAREAREAGADVVGAEGPRREIQNASDASTSRSRRPT